MGENMMRVDNIHSNWGTIVSGTYDEVVSMGAEYWRNLGYARDMIVFRGLGKLEMPQQFRILEYFGVPWTAEEYAYSKELPIKFDYHGREKSISVISNLISKRLGGNKMPWHVDIPNHGENSFPWRSLYMVNNPNPDHGLTEFCSLRLETIKPTPEELQLYEDIEVINQSWYRQGEEICRQKFIKEHPITGIKSLRANYFVDELNPDSTRLAWIKSTLYKGSEVGNYATLAPIYKRITALPEASYIHKWDLYDLIVYDNWNLMHRRTECKLSPGEERKFYRTNINHYPHLRKES